MPKSNQTSNEIFSNCLDSTSSFMNLAALFKKGAFGFQTHEHLIKLLDKYIFSL